MVARLVHERTLSARPDDSMRSARLAIRTGENDDIAVQVLDDRQFTESEHAQAKLREHYEKYGEPEEMLAQLRGSLERAQGLA